MEFSPSLPCTIYCIYFTISSGFSYLTYTPKFIIPGVGPNIALARMATRHAKPDGQFMVTVESAKEFMRPNPVKDLSGVGRSTGNFFCFKYKSQLTYYNHEFTFLDK